MKKQDLAKLAILGMLGVSTSIAAQQQPSPSNGQSNTDYDGSRGISTEKVSNYSSSDPSQAGKPVPTGGKPGSSPGAQTSQQGSEQKQQTAAKVWQSGGAKCGSSLAGCSGKGSCTGLTSCKDSANGACNHDSCGGVNGTCGSDEYSQESSSNLKAKRNLR